jgi:hypothetical protein
LEIPSDVAEQWIIPKGYVKPNIVVGRNYYLKWEDSSYGISQNEVSDLKGVLNDLLELVSSKLYEAAKGIHATLHADASGKAKRIEEVFSPQLLLRRKRGNIIYIFQMKPDGSTVIVRSERILFSNSSDERNSAIKKNNRQIYATWILGELLFNRQKVQNRYA